MCCKAPGVSAAWVVFGLLAEPRELYDALLRIGSLPPSLVREELLAR